MSYRLYDKKVSEDKAPDMLIDTIMPNQARLDVALQNGGKTLIDVITIPAEKCVERAFQRAESWTQGFVPTGYIINSNINVAKGFHDIIDKNIGKNIEYKLVNNDVNWGEKPILIEEGKLKEKK